MSLIDVIQVMILHNFKSFRKNDGCARDYDAVFVDVQDVMIKSSMDEMTGWVSIGGVTPQVYDLLDLTGGVNVLC
jgi:hypothetical protein